MIVTKKLAYIIIIVCQQCSYLKASHLESENCLLSLKFGGGQSQITNSLLDTAKNQKSSPKFCPSIPNEDRLECCNGDSTYKNIHNSFKKVNIKKSVQDNYELKKVYYKKSFEAVMKNYGKYKKHAEKINKAVGVNLDCFKASDFVLTYLKDTLNLAWLAEDWNQELNPCFEHLKEVRAGVICSSCSKKSSKFWTIGPQHHTETGQSNQEGITHDPKKQKAMLKKLTPSNFSAKNKETIDKDKYFNKISKVYDKLNTPTELDQAAQNNKCNEISQWRNQSNKFKEDNPFYQITWDTCKAFTKKCTNFLLNDSIFRKFVKNVKTFHKFELHT